MGIPYYELDERAGKFCDHRRRFGAPASNESLAAPFYGTLMFFSWFNAGARILDILDPYASKDVGYFIPARNQNTDVRCDDEKIRRGCVHVLRINIVEVDERGVVYAVDRAISELFILRVTGSACNIMKPAIR
jgi:hypothetical protein